MELPAQNHQLTKKDLFFGLVAGVLVGVLFVPVLSAAKPGLSPLIFLGTGLFFLLAIPMGLWIASKLSGRLPVLWQLAKFIVTGGLNMMVDLGILTLLIFLFRSFLGAQPEDVVLSLGFSLTAYSLYKGMSFIVANINSYLWNKHWTFQKASDAMDSLEKTSSKSKEFVTFFLVSLIGLLVNNIAASLVFRSIGPLGGLSIDQWSLVGAVFGSIAGLAWNFIGYKFIVFKK